VNTRLSSTAVCGSWSRLCWIRYSTLYGKEIVRIRLPYK